MQFTQFIYFCEMLYMFQAVAAPIIRSSKLCIQHRVLCQTFTVTCHCHCLGKAVSVKVWQSTRCCIYSF